jgi:hypothetical protein
MRTPDDLKYDALCYHQIVQHPLSGDLTFMVAMVLVTVGIVGQSLV